MQRLAVALAGWLRGLGGGGYISVPPRQDSGAGVPTRPHSPFGRVLRRASRPAEAANGDAVSRAVPYVRAKLGCAEVREAAGKRAFAESGVMEEHIWATMPDSWRETWRVRAVAIVTSALDSMDPGDSTHRL